MFIFRLKNKLFSKKKDNYNKSNLLKTKLMTDKELVYHQNQIKAMKLKKENNFNNERLYEVGTYYKKKNKKMIITLLN